MVEIDESLYARRKYRLMLQSSGSSADMTRSLRKGSWSLYHVEMLPPYCQLSNNGFCMALRCIPTCGRLTTSLVQLAMGTVR